MSEFTASNGIGVGRSQWGGVYINDRVAATLNEEQALREFFLHERDDELGRWRWPENSDYVVYIAPECADYDVRITCETSGDSMVYTRSEDDGHNRDHPWESLWARAARAYFDAHPEPKPWHNAQYGEVWELDTVGTSSWVVLEAGDSDEPRPVFRDIRSMDTMSLDSASITGGRLLWKPEVES